MSVKVLILTGYGINAEKELEWAFELAGANSFILHLEDLIENKKILNEYQILAFPGGFSFGDHIASGKVFANIVRHNLLDEIKNFILDKKLIIGICNGFQILVKLGIIPDFDFTQKQVASLVENDSGHFENRWVYVKTEKNNSPWLKDINSLYLPVRHGEGKFIVQNENVLKNLIKNNQIAFRYFNPNSNSTGYPYNPNGSTYDIAGILNPEGNILGLMPHPEAFIFTEHHPRWTENIDESKNTGLKLFKNAVDYFK